MAAYLGKTVFATGTDIEDLRAKVRAKLITSGRKNVNVTISGNNLIVSATGFNTTMTVK